MEWWVWVIAGVAVICLVADWFIVMGPRPNEWKGDKKHDHIGRPGR